MAAAVVVAAGVAIAVWLWTLPSSADGLSMGDYGPEKQWERAQQLVAGLNTGDVEQVPVLRAGGRLSAAQARTVEAAMPAAGCRYNLVSVSDRGVKPRHHVPGLKGENSTHRFDMTVEQRCSTGAPRPRTIGVVAVAEMGFWGPFLFAVE